MEMVRVPGVLEEACEEREVKDASYTSAQLLLSS